jgi:galactokinase
VSSPSRESIAAQFLSTYGRAPAVIARAPGRVEFIGNHTDYNGGAVLGAAIDRYVWVAAAPNAPGRLRLFSVGGKAVLELPSDPGARITGSDSWANYPLGVWRSLKDFGLPQPPAFELAGGVRPAARRGPEQQRGARAGHGAGLAQAGWQGRPAGRPARGARTTRREPIRRRALRHPRPGDERASARPGISCISTAAGRRSPRVPFPANAHLWIFNTREKHALIDGFYATRHQECLDAAKALGVAFLADLTPAQLEAKNGALSPALAKRAKHIVEEHARVRDTAEALRRGDLAAVGRLLTASHRSSQHLFENSTPALDLLVDLLAAHPAVLGARLTGGGFGGAVMALTKDNFTAADAAGVARAYRANHGREPEMIHLQAADGAMVLG